MRNQLNVCRSALIVLLIMLSYSASTFATYVYAITSHNDSTLRAYEIQGGGLQEKSLINVTDEESGAVGIACADSIGRLFVTYESSATIVWANTQTLEQEGYIDVYDTGELAGVAWDSSRELLYALMRGQPHLFVCAWDPNDTGANTLALMDPNNPTVQYDSSDPNTSAFAILEDFSTTSGAFGLAVDSNTGYLYVTNNSRYVYCYDPSDWSFIGTRDVNQAAVGIAIDPCNSEHPGYLYTGGL